MYGTFLLLTFKRKLYFHVGQKYLISWFNSEIGKFVQMKLKLSEFSLKMLDQ